MSTPDRFYTSRAGYAAMMRWYENALTRFTVPITRRFIKTCCGVTHVISAGDPTAPPLMLLHGINVNAIGWRQQFALLAPHFHLIAPDVIGFSGMSDAVRPDYDSDAHTRWLMDVLDAYNAARAGIVGTSGGGWHALKLAAHHPERVAALTLVNPLGITRLPYPQNLFRNAWVCALVGEFGRRVMATHAGARRLVRLGASPDAPQDNDTVEMAYLLLKYFRRRAPPAPLTPAELSQVRAPLTLLVGEQDPYLNVRRLVDMAQHHLPQVRAFIFPRGGHDLHNDRAETVAQHILETVGKRTESCDDSSMRQGATL